MTQPTLEDIEAQVNSSPGIRFAMNRVINQLKAMEKKMGDAGPGIIQSLLNGKNKLSPEEYAETGKRFGPTGMMAIEAMEHLTKPQKQYVFKQMGYDPALVE
jgi:hypothetical protein